MNPDNSPSGGAGGVSVNSTNPSDNSTGIAVNTQIVITFSDSMNAGTLTTSTDCNATIQISPNNFSSCIAGTIDSGSNPVITFTPTAALTYSTTYRINVTTAVQSSAGDPLTVEFITTNGFITPFC